MKVGILVIKKIKYNVKCIKIISGLGNYKKKYINTRHNIGFWYIKYLLIFFKKNIIYKKKYKYGNLFKLKINNKNILIFISKSYINNSGINIKIILKKYKLNVENLLIVYDDIDLYIGNIKLKYNGNNYGHKGIDNIINILNNKNFYKLKIGIKNNYKIKDIKKFVLQIPNYYEKKIILKSIYKSILGTNILLKNINILEAFKFINTK